MNGAIGIHVEANSEGYSRDRAIQCARNVGGGYATIVNDPQLCMMMLDVGVTPIHRINRAGLLDDNQDQYGTTRLYIQTATTECPDPRILKHWNNEPAHNPFRLLREGLIAVDEAVRLGQTLVMLSWSYGNPEQEVHDILDPLYRRMAETGMIYSCHEGTDISHPTLASCYPNLIGRFLPIQKKYGFRVIVTEFAASKDAHNGWQTWDSNYARVCDDTVRHVYAPNGVYMTPFTAFRWKNGFDYIDSPALQASWRETNRSFPVTQLPNHNWGARIDGATASMTTNINVRTLPNESSQAVGVIHNGDVLTYWNNPYDNPASAYSWYKILYQGVERFVADVSSLTFTPPTGKQVIYSEADVTAMKEHAAAITALLSKGVPSNSGGSF